MDKNDKTVSEQVEKEIKKIQITESELNVMSDEELISLAEQQKNGEIEVEFIEDISEKEKELTYFTEPILIEEDTIIKNKKFKEGLEVGYEMGGILTGMVNSGFSLEMAENYVVESKIIELKLKIMEMEMESKKLEAEMAMV